MLGKEELQRGSPVWRVVSGNNQDNLKRKSSCAQSLAAAASAFSGTRRSRIPALAAHPEAAMHTDATRRHADGSIDFDFYRRKAARLRTRAIRNTFARPGGARMIAVAACLAGALIATVASVPAVRLAAATHAGGAVSTVK
jgi:hypothetical protein